MDTGAFQIGSRAIIKKKVRRDDSEFTTQIQNVEGDKIRILTPMYKSALIRLHPETRIELSVFSGSKFYQFDAEVIDSMVEDNLYYTDIKVTSTIRKIERRDYFRVEAMKDILVRKKDDKSPKDYSRGITIDLSGGGVQFSSTQVFSEGTVIEMKIDIDGEELQLEGEILRRQAQEGLGSYKYTVKFLDLNKLTQDIIVKFVFKIQREKLSKEM